MVEVEVGKVETYSLLHFFCTNLSLQAVLYVDSRMESKSWAPEEEERQLVYVDTADIRQLT